MPTLRGRGYRALLVVRWQGHKDVQRVSRRARCRGEAQAHQVLYVFGARRPEQTLRALWGQWQRRPAIANRNGPGTRGDAFVFVLRRAGEHDQALWSLRWQRQERRRQEEGPQTRAARLRPLWW